MTKVIFERKKQGKKWSKEKKLNKLHLRSSVEGDSQESKSKLIISSDSGKDSFVGYWYDT